MSSGKSDEQPDGAAAPEEQPEAAAPEEQAEAAAPEEQAEAAAPEEQAEAAAPEEQADAAPAEEPPAAEVAAPPVAATAHGHPANGYAGNGYSGNGQAGRPEMRGMIPGLESPHLLGHMLPGVLQDDEFAQRFVSGLDTVLAPVFSTLDNVDAYLDPQLTPPDFLPWLAGWHGVELDAGWPEARSRDLMSRLPELQARRGTVSTLREVLRLHLGSEPEIIDSGGASWSAVPGGDLPGSPAHEVTVRVKATASDRARIEALVADHTPAHVVVNVEVVDP